MPIDHGIFDAITSAQWLWYFHNFSQDDSEQFTQKRDLSEYTASFYAPQAVQNVRKERETAKKAQEIDDTLFATRVGKLFGREFKKGLPEIKDEYFDVLQSAIENNNIEPRKIDESRNYKHWAKLKLDK